MNIKKYMLIAALSGLAIPYTYAQSVDDAYAFSKDDNPATARIKGMGNVQTALGGDISTINGNPAGLGFFSRSDISITFDYLNNNNKTDFLGTNSSSKKGNFGVSQAGVVFNFPNYNQYNNYRGWQNLNLGISYNRKQNFNNSLVYSGINNETSYVNNLTDIMAADGSFSNDLKSSNLVEQFSDPSKGYFPLAAEFEGKDQINDVLTKGTNNNLALGFGANYNNNFYIGATLGVTFFNYEKSKIFEENGWTKLASDVAEDNPNSPFADPNSAQYQKFGNKSYGLFDEYNQNSEGSGIDLKIGMIYKPTPDWNLGLTITTPTWVTVNETTEAFTDIDFYENMTSNISFHSYQSDLYQSQQDYNITTPWKLSAGATKFFGRGLFSAEVEYVTYNTISYSSPSGFNAFRDVNDDIKANLQGAANIRLGGEYLFNDIVSGRAGFNYFGNAYKGTDETNINGSIGLGFKLNSSTYLDFALIQSYNKYYAAPYSLSGFWHELGSYEPIANLKHHRTNAMITIGAKF